MRIGNLTGGVDQVITSRDGQTFNNSPTEFQVLAALARAKGRVLSRTEIIEKAWKKGEGLVNRRTVDVLVGIFR